MRKLHLGFACAAALAGCNSGSATPGADGGTDSGTGMYARRLDITVGTLPQALVVADMNNDQRPDVLVGRATGALSLVSTNSAGTITAALLSSSLADTVYGLGVADFDGDGKLDAAVARSLNGTAAVLFGADFSTKVDFGDGAHPIAVAVGDVNSDGKPDVLTANTVGSAVGVMLNLGNRMFASRVNYDLGTVPSALLLGATDGARPSRLDIVAVLPGLNKIRILLGQGGGAYVATQFTDLMVGQNPAGLAMADLNGDQSPDLVVTNRKDNAISVLLSQGGGTFAAAMPYSVGTEPLQVALGDIDGDGNLDAVVTNSGSSSISILRGQGGGMLRLTDTVTVGINPQPVVITDIDGDGQKDILVGNNGTMAAPGNTLTILFGKKI